MGGRCVWGVGGAPCPALSSGDGPAGDEVDAAAEPGSGAPRAGAGLGLGRAAAALPARGAGCPGSFLKREVRGAGKPAAAAASGVLSRRPPNPQGLPRGRGLEAGVARDGGLPGRRLRAGWVWGAGAGALARVGWGRSGGPGPRPALRAGGTRAGRSPGTASGRGGGCRTGPRAQGAARWGGWGAAGVPGTGALGWRGLLSSGRPLGTGSRSLPTPAGGQDGRWEHLSWRAAMGAGGDGKIWILYQKKKKGGPRRASLPPLPRSQGPSRSQVQPFLSKMRP